MVRTICCSSNRASEWGRKLHGFPKDKATLRQWVHFVRVRRAHVSMTSVTANTRICSAHFKEDYDEGDARMVSLGLKTERLAKLNRPPGRLHSTSLPAATTPRGTKKAEMLRCAGEPEAQDGQCGDTDPNFPPLTSPEQTDDEDDPSVISDSSWVPGGHMSEDEEELCEEEPSHTCDPHQNGIDKFIVCQEVLMSLFALCPACCEKSDSLCIMWLPTFLAKPANAPQEHGVSYFGSHNLLVVGPCCSCACLVSLYPMWFCKGFCMLHVCLLLIGCFSTPKNGLASPLLAESGQQRHLERYQ
ncbi:hypothetical protein N1851_030472 [Merluccius polli]|uniref:THAP-type domain-containing protein n=1 Tax=Merluccius polli TaxID=89951 RepID=A0AA47M5J4_MERPO|nr:hypothetical protein N1851_030472 [Merluccius polli]